MGFIFSSLKHFLERAEWLFGKTHLFNRRGHPGWLDFSPMCLSLVPEGMGYTEPEHRQLWFRRWLICHSSLLLLREEGLFSSPFFSSCSRFIHIVKHLPCASSVIPGPGLTHWNNKVLFQQNSELISHIWWVKLAHRGVPSAQRSQTTHITKRDGDGRKWVLAFSDGKLQGTSLSTSPLPSLGLS